MNGAILLIDHGSRREEANAQLETLAAALRERIEDTLIETAHLELAQPDIATGLERCVESGATAIIVLPYLLGPGRHTTDDLPQAIEIARARHPGVEIRLADPLGIHGKVIDVLLERLEEAARD